MVVFYLPWTAIGEFSLRADVRPQNFNKGPTDLPGSPLVTFVIKMDP